MSGDLERAQEAFADARRAYWRAIMSGAGMGELVELAGQIRAAAERLAALETGGE